MYDTIKEWFWRIVVILVFVFMIIDSMNGDKPTDFKRWAYIARDKDSAQWERVIAHIDSDMVSVSPDDEERRYFIYAIEYPDSGKICDADAQCWELENDRALSLTIFSSYNDTSSDYYIRLTDEEVK